MKLLQCLNHIRPLLIVVLVICFSIKIHAQSRYYFGTQGGLDFDQWLISESNGVVAQKPIISGSYGILVGRQIQQNFEIETGFIRKHYNEGFGVYSRTDLGNFASYSFSSTSFQIPILLRGKLSGKSGNWSIFGQIGYHICMNSEYGSEEQTESTVYKYRDTLTVWETTNYKQISTFGLLNSGIGIEWKVFCSMRIAVSASYFSGFKNLSVIDVQYQVNKDSIGKVQITNRGDYFAWHVKLVMPFNAFSKTEATVD